MHSPIFILGTHKTGTSLLRSLFDHHDDLFVVPVESHFFQHARAWVDYPLRRTLPSSSSPSVEDFCENAKRWVRHCNSAEDRLADSVARGAFDYERFADCLEATLLGQTPQVTDFRSWFAAYMKALHYSLYGEELSPSRRVLEKSVENVEFAGDFQRMFPNASFVHIIRNPYATMVALRKYKSAGGFPILYRILRSIYLSFYHLERNSRTISNYHVVRYEDLATKPEEVMGRLCEALAIPFSESLLTPTSQGAMWQGNSSSGEAFSGVSAKRLQAWRQNITPLELELVNKHLGHVLQAYSYEPYVKAASPLAPVKGERLKPYIANRVLLRLGV